MSVLSRLTLANLRQNKRRTLFTALGAMLATALMLAVVGMISSVQQTFVEAAIASTGDYHEMYEKVPKAASKYIEDNANVESYFYGSNPTLTDEEAEFYQENPHYVYNKILYEIEPEPQEYANIFVRYKNVSAYEHTRETILNTLRSQTGTEVNYRTNRLLIEYEGGLSEAAMQEFVAVGAIVLTIIVVTSVFTIRNSFSISAAERMREFGMLGSVGATRHQIRRSVVLEGALVWIASAPLGILLGIAATVILAQTVNILLGDSLNIEMVLVIPAWSYLAVIMLSFITVFFSALIPAIRAAKLSPIDAIRASRDIKINPKKVHTSRLTRKIFGVGGVIASKNLKRSRGKYRTTVVSIVLSVATFIGFSTFMDQAFGNARIFYSQVDYNLIMSSDYDEVIADIIHNFKLDKVAQYQQAAISAQDFDIAVVDQTYFEEFAKTIGIKNNFDEVAILNDYILSPSEGHARALKHTLSWQPGTEVAIVAYDETENAETTHEEIITITHITETAPLGHEFDTYPVVLVSEHYAKNHGLSTLGYTTVFAKTDVADQIVQHVAEKGKTDDRYRDAYADNIRESARVMNNLYLLVAIFFYGFIAVITLIGITNVLNTISANMILRASDFASLKSVGMTSREFNKMIRLESLMYSAKALLIGVPIGLLISYGFYKAMSGTYDFGYRVPLQAIAMAIVAVAVLVSAIMRYSVKLVNKQNIIETIRSDTV